MHIKTKIKIKSYHRMTYIQCFENVRVVFIGAVIQAVETMRMAASVNIVNQYLELGRPGLTTGQH